MSIPILLLLTFQLQIQHLALWPRGIEFLTTLSFAVIAFVRLFSTVCFQMLTQVKEVVGKIIVGLQREFSTTLSFAVIAFVRLFSTVCFQMLTQVKEVVGKIIVGLQREFSTLYLSNEPHQRALL